MGKFFAKFFRAQGFKVYVADLGTKLSCKEAVQKSDIVMFAVPIAKTVEVIKETLPYLRKEQVICDVTSLKLEPMKAMLKVPGGISVVGLHPMFGPNVNSLEKQTVVVCPGRGGQAKKFFKQLFEKAGAKVVEMKAVEHDQTMLAVQGVMHLTTLLAAKILKDLKLDLRKSLQVSSPIYRLRFDLLARILGQDAELYADILRLNSGAKDLAKCLKKSAAELEEALISTDKKKFLQLFDEGSMYFGDFKKKAAQESDAVIEYLVNI